jgi:hypothetical protein
MGDLGERGTPTGVQGRSPRRKIFFVNVYCKVADLMVEFMLGLFSLEGNPLLRGKLYCNYVSL